MFFRILYKKKVQVINLKMHLYRFAVIGGDMRQVYLAELLAGRGNQVTTYALKTACTNPKDEQGSIEAASTFAEAVKDADIIAAPVPFLKAGALCAAKTAEDFTAAELLLHMKQGSRLFAGGIPEEFAAAAEKKNIQCIDYMKDEAMAIANTAAAAEGILAEAVSRSPRTLFGSTCLLFGYGRCGSTLAGYLRSCGTELLVYETEESAGARAKLAGGKLVKTTHLQESLQKADFIFNTVPSMVLPKALLGYVRKDALLLDLASAPGGVDYKAAEGMGISAVWLPGLPGKYAPLTSAQLLEESIERSMNRLKQVSGR